MNTHDIELPAEFRSGNDITVTQATIKRERMQEILRDAIEADRQQRGEPVAWLTPGMDLHLENPEGFADWVPLYSAPVAAQTAEIARLRDGIEEAIRLLGMDRPIDPTDTLRAALSGESKC